MTISPERLLIPINGVCDSLGVGRTKVYELINQHEIVQVSIGRRSFVTTESLVAYVGRLAEEATSALLEEEAAADEAVLEATSTLLEEEAAADEAVLAAEQEKAAV
jgi:hypothetical protein